MANGGPDSDRAKKTIYVTGFNPKLINKRLLEEIFIQGGPIKDITLFETHAYILFDDEESVPYCLALFNDIELHGQKLRLSPRFKSDETFSYLKYLRKVRDKLMSQYMKIAPPKLPPKIMPSNKTSKTKSPKRGKKLSDRVRENYKFSGISPGSNDNKKRQSKSKKSKKPKSRKSKSKYRQKIKIKD